MHEDVDTADGSDETKTLTFVIKLHNTGSHVLLLLSVRTLLSNMASSRRAIHFWSLDLGGEGALSRQRQRRRASRTADKDQAILKMQERPGQLMFSVDGGEIPNHFAMHGFALATPEHTDSVRFAGTAEASNAMTVTPAAVFQFLRLAATRTPGLALTT
jgi:hypothetical protein